MAIYFLNVPQAITKVFSQSGITPIPVTEIPSPDPQSIIIWYARTEEEIMLFESTVEFKRKIILAPDSLILENPSVTAILLRQNEVEMYYPFLATDVPRVFTPEHHWFSVKSQFNDNLDNSDKISILFSGTGKDSLAVTGPANSGKTSIILSLAAALANTRAKVLVVDATNNNDLLYRIKLSESAPPITFKIILSFLEGQKKIKLNQINDKIDVIPGAPNEPLKTEEFHYVIDSLKDNYSFILFDCSNNPNDIGRFALKIASRVLVVVNQDILPLTSWHEEVFKTLMIPRNKISIAMNGIYPSRYQKRETIPEYLQLPIIARIPAAYNESMDAKLGFTIPYNLADEVFRDSIDSLMANLWGISKPNKQKTKLTDRVFDFLEGKGLLPG